MSTLVHAVVGYFYLLLTIRIMARRPGAQLTLYEFVLVFLVGGIIILTTVGNDKSVTNCVMAIITICLLHRLVSAVTQRWPRVGHIINGRPVVLMTDGNWNIEAMQHMRIADTDVMAAARGSGLKSLSDVKYAVLERNGDISIIRRQQDA